MPTVGPQGFPSVTQFPLIFAKGLGLKAKTDFVEYSACFIRIVSFIHYEHCEIFRAN